MRKNILVCQLMLPELYLCVSFLHLISSKTILEYLNHPLPHTDKTVPHYDPYLLPASCADPLILINQKLILLFGNFSVMVHFT